jgi:hypothetical protein
MEIARPNTVNPSSIKVWPPGRIRVAAIGDTGSLKESVTALGGSVSTAPSGGAVEVSVACA